MDQSLPRGSRAARGLTAAALTVCSALLFLLFFLQIYSCDDHLYTCFLDHGLGKFLELMQWHYKEWNGRLLVHGVASVALHFGHISVAVMGLAFLWGCCLLGLRLSGAKGLPLTGLVLCLAGILLLPLAVLQEGVMWISAFYNYVFPFLLLAALLLLLRRQRSAERLRWYEAPALLLLAFCCGFSTELYGLLCCALLGWTLLWALLRREKRPWLILPALAAAAGGLALILLSPATAGRAGEELRFDAESLLENLKAQGALLRSYDCMLPLFVGLQAGLALFGRQKGKALPGCLCAAGALFPVLLLVLPEQGPGWLSYPALLAVLLAEALLLTLRGEEGMGLLLLAAPLVQLIMLFTQSYVPRTLVACTLPLLPVLGACVERGGLRAWPRLALALLLTAAALAVTLPSVPDRAYNYRISRQNEASAERARSTGVMEAQLDCDPRYNYHFDFMDPMFPWFLRHHGLTPEQTVIHPAANRKPLIFVNGKQVDTPAILGRQTTFYQLRSIAEGIGAEFECPEPYRYRLSWEGVTVSLDCDADSAHYRNTVVRWTDPEGETRQFRTRVQYLYGCEEPFCDEAFFQKVWGLQFEQR